MGCGTLSVLGRRVALICDVARIRAAREARLNPIPPTSPAPLAVLVRHNYIRLRPTSKRGLGRPTLPVMLGRWQQRFTSKELKVKTKANNISGLQLADIVAHPSRNEILKENGLLDREIAPFPARIIAILQHKYDRLGSRVFGKKLI